MNIWRAIIVHALAASLLLVGVCPCSGPNLTAKTVSGKCESDVGMFGIDNAPPLSLLLHRNV